MFLSKLGVLVVLYSRVSLCIQKDPGSVYSNLSDDLRMRRAGIMAVQHSLHEPFPMMHGRRVLEDPSGQQGVDSVIELRKRRAEARQRSREQLAGNNQAHVITPPEQDTDLFDDYDVDGYSSEDYKDDLAVNHEHDVVLWLKKPPSVDKVVFGKEEDRVIHSEEHRKGKEDLTSQSEEQQKNLVYVDENDDYDYAVRGQGHHHLLTMMMTMR